MGRLFLLALFLIGTFFAWQYLQADVPAVTASVGPLSGTVSLDSGVPLSPSITRGVVGNQNVTITTSNNSVAYKVAQPDGSLLVQIPAHYSGNNPDLAQLTDAEFAEYVLRELMTAPGDATVDTNTLVISAQTLNGMTDPAVDHAPPSSYMQDYHHEQTLRSMVDTNAETARHTVDRVTNMAIENQKTQAWGIIGSLFVVKGFDAVIAVAAAVIVVMVVVGVRDWMRRKTEQMQMEYSSYRPRNPYRPYDDRW